MSRRDDCGWENEFSAGMDWVDDRQESVGKGLGVRIMPIEMRKGIDEDCFADLA